MPTVTRKKLLKTVTSVDIGCSSCIKPKLFHMFRPKAKTVTAKLGRRQSQSQSHHYSSSSSCNNNDYSSSFLPITNTTTDDYASFSDDVVHEKSNKQEQYYHSSAATPVKGVPVEKDSGDPYLDFRHSMLQMILENEIYSKDDLRELLNCFLQLNAPCNHGIIIRAFTDIWNGVFSLRSTAASSPMPPLRRARKSRDY